MSRHHETNWIHLLLKCFIFSGLPFHLARNSHFISLLLMLQNSLSGHVSFGYNMLRTSLLQKKTNIGRSLVHIKSIFFNMFPP